MINFDDVTKEKINKYNQNWPQMPCHLYTVLIIGVSGFGKTNALLNLIKKKQDDDNYNVIDKTHLYFKDPFEAKF